jgi:sugar phosphate permease
MGVTFVSLTLVATTNVEERDAGLASGIFNTSQQIGGALGLAVLATVSAGRTSALLARHAATPAALAGGYRLAFWIAFALVVAAIGVSVAVLRPTPAKTADPDVAEPGLRPAAEVAS